MNISITPELEQFVHAKVKSGMYQSASEVFREALRLLAERDELHRRRLEKLDEGIQAAMDEMARGEGITEAQLMQHIERRKKAFFDPRG